jgi:hypothetical protein
LDGEYFLLAAEYPQKLTLQDWKEWKCINYTNINLLKPNGYWMHQQF